MTSRKVVSQILQQIHAKKKQSTTFLSSVPDKRGLWGCDLSRLMTKSAVNLEIIHAGSRKPNALVSHWFITRTYSYPEKRVLFGNFY